MPASLTDRPIQVVVFTSGPPLERGVLQFLRLLEEHRQIDLLACIAQSRVRGKRAMYTDLWRRRGILAAPILFSQWVNAVWRFLRHPSREMTIQNTLPSLSERIHFVPDIHAQQVLYLVSGLRPDLGLIYGSPILKPALFEIPALSTLGIHHGKVPEYRGKKTMFWAMYNGEQTVGVTIQKVNAGLDTGQIVKHGEVWVGRRFPGAVWDELNKLGLDLYIQAILEVKQGTASFTPQVGPRGKLYRDPTTGDVVRLWQRIFLRMVRKWLRI